MKKYLLPRIVVAATLSIFLVSGAIADGSAGEKRCLPLNRIDTVRVIDSEHIKFEMSGKTDYINTLPRKCPGLSGNKTIMYKTSLHSLCDLDTITVLDQVGGGYMHGATCGLGKFVPHEEDNSVQE